MEISSRNIMEASPFDQYTNGGGRLTGKIGNITPRRRSSRSNSMNGIREEAEVQELQDKIEEHHNGIGTTSKGFISNHRIDPLSPTERYKSPNTGVTSISPSAPSASNLIRLTLHKPMGIVFEPITVDGAERGVRISDLPRSGAASLSGKLTIGDELLSINDQTMSRLSFDEIMDFIVMAEAERVDLLFRRPRRPQLNPPRPPPILRDDVSIFSDDTELAHNLTSVKKQIKQRQEASAPPPTVQYSPLTPLDTCQTKAEVERAFHRRKTQHDDSSIPLIESTNGTEYAIDIVSKAGKYKFPAVWKFDKRCFDGVDVCFSTELVDCAEGRDAADFAKNVLMSLGMIWGMGRCRVLMEEGKRPRLLEFSASGKEYKSEFSALSSTCVGYNALDMLFASYLEQEDGVPEWDSLPKFPKLRSHGAIVNIICQQEGKVLGLEGVEEIQVLPSVLAMEIHPHFLEGNYVTKTVDEKSCAGWLRLVNADERQLRKDYCCILDLMPELFVIEGKRGKFNLKGKR